MAMRLLTRGDLDGLTSSVLLTLVESIGEIRFAHPKDVQDGKVPADASDIVVNLPFVKGCGMWFDHHVSEDVKLDEIGEFKGRFEVAPSCARVIYRHYNSPKFTQFDELMKETDRLDAAQLEESDVSDPKGWILLGYTLDPRTGLGPDFQKYFRWLVEYVKEVPLEKVLAHPLVDARIQKVQAEQKQYGQFLENTTRLEGTVIMNDLRGLKGVPVGNRFLVYTLHPEGNVEMRIFSGHAGATVVACGHSIFNRTCNVNIGNLMQKYGGGGHRGAGTCQLTGENVEAQIDQIKRTLLDNAPE